EELPVLPELAEADRQPGLVRLDDGERRRLAHFRHHSIVRAIPSSSVTVGLQPTSSRRRRTSATTSGVSASDEVTPPTSTSSGRPTPAAIVSTTARTLDAVPLAMLTGPTTFESTSAANALPASSTYR